MPEECSVVRVEPASVSAELVLFRVQMEGLITVLGRKKGERFLRVMADKLADEESLSGVFPIRPGSQWKHVCAARRQAAEIFSRYMPVWTARLPPH